MKPTIISLLVAGALVWGALLLINGDVSKDVSQNPSENVSVVDGVQFVDIRAKGGYSPRITYAASGIPTVLRIQTNNTFDCSSSLVIPSLGYRANLEPLGTTEIKLSPQKKGSKIRGLCTMGMYGFEVRFN